MSTRVTRASHPAIDPHAAALAYAEQGIPVLALRGKLPRIPAAHPPGDPLHQQCRGECGQPGHGVHDATCDPEQLRAWWQRWPTANIGLRCGVRFDVLDVDGDAGRHSLQRFLTEHGGAVIGGPRVRTGSGGWHLYVEPTGLPDQIGVLDHVDYRAADRYVVAPPSRHPTTRQPYRWVPGREVSTPLGQLPEALRELLIPPPKFTRDPAPTVRAAVPGHPYGRAALQAECAELAATPKGERNRQLWASARNLYNLVAGGVLAEVEVDRAIRHAAHQCGLLHDEPRQTEATLASARQVGLAHPRGLPDQPRDPTDASPHPPPRSVPERTPER
jgi:hypothetical protein